MSKRKSTPIELEPRKLRSGKIWSSSPTPPPASPPNPKHSADSDDDVVESKRKIKAPIVSDTDSDSSDHDTASSSPPSDDEELSEDEDTCPKSPSETKRVVSKRRKVNEVLYSTSTFPKSGDEWCSYIQGMYKNGRLLTYTGSTPNICRRTHEHNGETPTGAKSKAKKLKGAKTTTRRIKDGQWKPICTIGGPAMTERAARQFEYRVKHAHLKLVGDLPAKNVKINRMGKKINARVKLLLTVACLEYWTRKMKASSIKASDVPLTIRWYNLNEKPHESTPTYLPPYVTEVDHPTDNPY